MQLTARIKKTNFYFKNRKERWFHKKNYSESKIKKKENRSAFTRNPTV